MESQLKYGEQLPACGAGGLLLPLCCAVPWDLLVNVSSRRQSVLFTGNVLSWYCWGEGHRSQPSLLDFWDFCSSLTLFLLLPDLVQKVGQA